VLDGQAVVGVCRKQERSHAFPLKEVAMDTSMPAEVRQQHAHVTRQLVEEFGDRIPPEFIVHRASERLRRYQGARVLTFVPTLVWRYTREELKAHAA